MKIAFWSPVHGQAGTTSNIMSVAILTGMVYQMNSILMQTHFGLNNMEAPLVGSNIKTKASSDYFKDVGLDALARNFKSARLDREVLDNCCITLSDSKVSLLPGTAKNNRESYEYEMNNILLPLQKAMEEFTRILFVDVNAGYSPLALKILEDCDMKVINLSQNIGILENYFSNCSEGMKNKVFYLIGNYDDNSKYNLHNLRRKYPKYMTVANSGVIPKHTSYMDAQCDGRVVEFIKSNLYCNKKDENYHFINQLQKTVKKILCCAGIDTDSEERKF